MKITVKYWIGTVRYTGTATTYRGATRLASKNRNSYDPSYFDSEGKELYDCGFGLVYCSQPNSDRIECAV